MFPSPALDSLETLRSSIYAGIDKHGKESLGAVKKRNAGQPGSGRGKESVADERLTAGKGGKEGWQEISAQDIWQSLMQKPISAEHHEKQDKKNLSAEHEGISAEVSIKKATEGAREGDGAGEAANAV